MYEKSEGLFLGEISYTWGGADKNIHTAKEIRI